jgi:predicted lysophospholipase L1 biosynthesis ABC-type transport system permease subunit
VSQFFPAGNAIGQRFGDGFSGNIVKPEWEIVGVIADAKYRSLREPFIPTFFTCSCGTHSFEFFPTIHLEVRTNGRPEAVIPAIESVLRHIDPQIPFSEIHTLNDEVETSLWAERTMARLGSGFSVMAALLAGIGLYGLLSYTLAQRSREIGIRMALGATPSDIVKATAVRTLTLVLVGVAAGLAASLLTAQFLRSLLYGVSPWDPWANLAGIGLVIAVATIASVLPATRAARLDPSTALRCAA